MIKIAIIHMINKLDDIGLYKQSDIIEKCLVNKMASENLDFGDMDDSNFYTDEVNYEDLERSDNETSLLELLSKDIKTLDDKEQIAYLISVLGGKPYEPDPETMKLQELLGDPHLYPAHYEEAM